MTYGHWAWPQITIAALWALGLILNAANHGKDTGVKYNFPLQLCRVTFVAWVFWMGGWWE